MIDRTHKSSLLWGVVGGLSFLVLVQAYHLLAREFISLPVILVVTLLVIVSTAVLTHRLRPRFLRSNERP